MPKVYVPQVPSRLDRGTRLWVPIVDLSAANRFGEQIELLPPEANRMHIAPLVAAMKEGMKDMAEDDYIVAVGDPSLIGTACCIMSRKFMGRVRILKWDRNSNDYIPVEIQI